MGSGCIGVGLARRYDVKVFSWRRRYRVMAQPPALFTSGLVPVTISPRYYGDGALPPAPTTLEMTKIEVAGDWCVCVGSGFDGRTLERLP